jgi:hypothetical protein
MAISPSNIIRGTIDGLGVVAGGMLVMLKPRSSKSRMESWILMIMLFGEVIQSSKN